MKSIPEVLLALSAPILTIWIIARPLKSTTRIDFEGLDYGIYKILDPYILPITALLTSSIAIVTTSRISLFVGMVFFFWILSLWSRSREKVEDQVIRTSLRRLKNDRQ